MLNISKEIHVGLMKNTSGIPEAEIIPDGTAANEKKKIESLYNRKPDAKKYPNVPLPGFTIKSSKSKSWSSPETVWEVIDPRGFYFSISSKNLQEILKVSGITENLIQQRCVWVRDDSSIKLSLLPVTADEYDKAVNNTKLLEEKVSIKEVNIGDKVYLQNGMEGTYAGTFTLYGKMSTSYRTDTYKPDMSVRRQIIEVKPNCYFHASDAKILKVVSKATNPLTREQSMAELNKKISSNSAYFCSWDHFPNATNFQTYVNKQAGELCLISTEAAKPKLKAVEITKQEVANYITRFNYLVTSTHNSTNYSLIVEDKRGYFWMPLSSVSGVFNARRIINLDINNIGEEIQYKPSTHAYYRYNHNDDSLLVDKTMNDFSKFYIIEKHLKKDVYL